MIKLLNYNPNSFAMTFLYCMTPNFYQDNISTTTVPRSRITSGAPRG